MTQKKSKSDNKIFYCQLTIERKQAQVNQGATDIICVIGSDGNSHKVCKAYHAETHCPYGGDGANVYEVELHYIDQHFLWLQEWECLAYSLAIHNRKNKLYISQDTIHWKKVTKKEVSKWQQQFSDTTLLERQSS